MLVSGAITLLFAKGTCFHGMSVFSCLWGRLCWSDAVALTDRFRCQLVVPCAQPRLRKGCIGMCKKLMDLSLQDLFEDQAKNLDMFTGLVRCPQASQHPAAMLSDSLTQTEVIQIRKVLTLALAASKNGKPRPTDVLSDLHRAGLWLPVHDTIDSFVDCPGERCEYLKSLATNIVDGGDVEEFVSDLVSDFNCQTVQRHLQVDTAEYASLAAQSLDKLESWLENRVKSDDEAYEAPSRPKEGLVAIDVTDRLKLSRTLGDKCPQLEINRLGESLVEFFDYLHRLKLDKTDTCMQADSLIRTFLAGVGELQGATSGLAVEPIATQLARVLAHKQSLFDLSVGRKYCEMIPQEGSVTQTSSANEIFELVHQYKKRVEGWYVLRGLLVVAKNNNLSVKRYSEDDMWVAEHILKHLTPAYRLDRYNDLSNGMSASDFLNKIYGELQNLTTAEDRDNSKKRGRESKINRLDRDEPPKRPHYNETTECRDWRKNSCRYGDTCKFAHTSQRGAQPPRQRSGDQTCFNMRDRGYCRFGDSCRYHHHDSQQTGTPYNAYTSGANGEVMGANAIPLNQPRMQTTGAMDRPHTTPVAGGEAFLLPPAGRARYLLPSPTVNPYMQPAGRGSSGARGGKGGKGGKGFASR